MVEQIEQRKESLYHQLPGLERKFPEECKFNSHTLAGNHVDFHLTNKITTQMKNRKHRNHNVIKLEIDFSVNVLNIFGKCCCFERWLLSFKIIESKYRNK